MVRVLFRAGACLIAAALPGPLKRGWLRLVLGWQLHPTCRIGPSLILADEVCLEEGASIGRLNIVSPIERLHLGPKARIGHRNWIAGKRNHPKFNDADGRNSALVLEEGGTITMGHYIECIDSVVVGKFSLVAGLRSQILTHSPDFAAARQVAEGVVIGKYTFVGTGSIILKGAVVPDHCIVAAGSVFSGKGHEEYRIYAGNPAAPVKELPRDLGYFTRTQSVL